MRLEIWFSCIVISATVVMKIKIKMKRQKKVQIKTKIGLEMWFSYESIYTEFSKFLPYK